MSRTALVTGASSGIGEAISRMLCREGWTVYGIGRTFTSASESPSFHPIACDLMDPEALKTALKQVPQQELSLLINNAGCAWYGLHETMNEEKIQAMVRTDLEIPMILCQKYLRQLRSVQGTILNVVSVTALSSSPHAAAYGAAKSGLLSFTRSLFEENRKYGMKVCAILPDLTDTNLYRSADFTPSMEQGCALSAEQVADAVKYMLSLPEGAVISELVLQPQKNRIERRRNHS
ncbi:MAG: SDR family NAD(P)-dependent oxidoreductase [Stecheria intestinalis]|nr:SDR family NAD(P)-dependent oxidoreductase [Stecheria intestinalis]